MSSEILERRACISGVGQSDIARRLPQSPMELTLDACLAANPGRAVFVDAPDDQASWRAELVARGFAIERPFLRMYRGRLEAPGEPSQIYAVTGPEFG